MDPCEPVTITGPDGARLTVSAYGGQVLGWSPSPESERLWLSPLSRCGDGAAIRGGIPVVFPQFSARGPLPKHGFARDRVWAASAADDPEAAAWQAELTSDDATLAIWPYPFVLRLRARATSSALEVALSVTNTGDSTFTFAAALHNYLRIGSADASIEGLAGHATEQNARPGEVHPAQPPASPDDTGSWPALEPRDVRVLDVHGPVTLRSTEDPALVITADGFPDRVAWNPGADNGIGDIPDGDERRFVCIEPAVVAPLELEPGQIWSGRQMFSIELPPGTRE